MNTPRIYTDTSVIGGCLDPEFRVASERLFDSFRSGQSIVVISDLTLQELLGAPEDVRRLLTTVPHDAIELIALTPDVDELAEQYIARGVVREQDRADARHIAAATIHMVDVLVSWNFKHIVSLPRIRGYNSVNMLLGYKILEIRTPAEIFSHDEEV